jgi:hypothetical protein
VAQYILGTRNDNVLYAAMPTRGFLLRYISYPASWYNLLFLPMLANSSFRALHWPNFCNSQTRCTHDSLASNSNTSTEYYGSTWNFLDLKYEIRIESTVDNAYVRRPPPPKLPFGNLCRPAELRTGDVLVVVPVSVKPNIMPHKMKRVMTLREDVSDKIRPSVA